MDFIKLAKEYQDEMVQDIIELVSIPSVYDQDSITKEAPFGKPIREALDWMLEKGKQDGFKSVDVDGYAGRISYGNQSESIGILGHLDVVPVTEGWTQDPFKVLNKDGYLIGRGTSDDKGPLMAGYYAMKILKDLNLQFEKQIDLILGCDEERDMACIDYYKKHQEVPVMGLVPDAEFPGVYAEKGILNVDIVLENNSNISSMQAGQALNIVIGEAKATLNEPVDIDLFNEYLKTNNLKGSTNDDEIRIIGKAFHASLPDQGVNAAIHLLHYLGQSNKQLEVIGKWLGHTDGSGLGINTISEMMGDLTLNLGMIKIDDNYIRLSLDIRYPKETNKQEIIKKIEAKTSALLENISDSEPHYVNPESDFVLRALSAYQKVTGDFDSKLITMGGGTYARTLKNHIAFGANFPNEEKPEGINDAHEIDEGVRIESLVLATAIYCEAICDLAGLIQ